MQFAVSHALSFYLILQVSEEDAIAAATEAIDRMPGSAATEELQRAFLLGELQFLFQDDILEQVFYT